MATVSRGGFARWAAKPPVDGERPGLRLRWRAWRRSRPFWGGLISLLAGGEILLTELAPLPVVVHFGAIGMIGFAVPILMMVSALMLWFAPQPRIFYAILILLLALGSWITSNLGGFILGMFAALVGGALALNWSAEAKRRRQPGEHQPNARSVPAAADTRHGAD